MKPILNGMLSPDLVRRLADLWPNGLHVITEYGERFPDGDLWKEARRRGLTIITKDHDFEDAAKHPGPPPRAVRLKIDNSSTSAVEEYIRDHAREIEEFSRSGDRYRESGGG